VQKSVQIGSPRGVDITQVERELAALWEEATRVSGPGDEPTVTRACAMNLVAVSDDPERARQEGEVLGDVSVAHPARILRLLEDAGASPSPVSVTVSARCTIPVPGRGQVCSEEIVVTARPGEALFSIVSSLLVADVPTIVLWRVPLDLADRLLLPLATVADRVLIDSTAAREPLQTLGRWHALMFSETGERALAGTTLAGDLSWTRLAPWRSMLASAVQSPDLRPLLDSGTILAVEYAGKALAQAILYGAWYSSRVGWKVRSVELSGVGGTLRLTARDGPAERTIGITRADGDGPEGMASVILSDAGGRRAELRRTETPGCMHITRVHDGVRTEESVRHPETGTEAALLVRELEILEHDEPYESAMRRAGEFLERVVR
jgi:glucose-6-phosphate dehydrogenase assembly protein OpcA